MVHVKDSKITRDLLTLKVFGYSNLKIFFFILAFTSFLLGWIILLIANPITSSMAKYYEQTNRNILDIDHLVTFNKNGLWIKEKFEKKEQNYFG